MTAIILNSGCGRWRFNPDSKNQFICGLWTEYLVDAEQEITA